MFERAQDADLKTPGRGGTRRRRGEPTGLVPRGAGAEGGILRPSSIRSD